MGTWHDRKDDRLVERKTTKGPITIQKFCQPQKINPMVYHMLRSMIKSKTTVVFGSLDPKDPEKLMNVGKSKFCFLDQEYGHLIKDCNNTRFKCIKKFLRENCKSISKGNQGKPMQLLAFITSSVSHSPAYK